MPASKRGAALVALTLGLLPAIPGAHADELLVMPYACSVIGGRTVLTRGPEVGHRIIGPREQRRFSACSPVNPDFCRQWTVYRFDLDCDGARVPWVSVVAAAGEMNRRARLVDGRLQLRMGARWSLPPDDPCAQEPDFDGRFGSGRMRRYCADRLAMAPPVVEMPFGFAPMLGLNAIFVNAAPRIGSAPPLPPLVAGALSDRGASSEPPRQMPLAEAPPPWQEREPATREAPAKAPAWPEATVQPPTRAEPATPGPTPGGTPKTTARTEATAGNPPPPDPKPLPKVTVAPPTPARDVAPSTSPPSRTTAEAEGNAISFNVFSVLRPATAGAIVAFGGLALGLLTAFAVARRRERQRHDGMRPRDISSVSLDGRHAPPPSRPSRATGSVPPSAAASAMSRVPGTGVPARSAIADWGDRMPATEAEAIQVLGIGVTPNANRAAVKKIVDGLRMSWHPDLARDEPDRQLRELRSKQINAAWEILQGERAEA